MEEVSQEQEQQVVPKPMREAFVSAWRPAGSMSLSERWLRAGETEEAPALRRSPPRPPALPSSFPLRPPKRIKRSR